MYYSIYIFTFFFVKNASSSSFLSYTYSVIISTNDDDVVVLVKVLQIRETALLYFIAYNNTRENVV